LPLPGRLGGEAADLRQALPYFPLIGAGLGLLLVGLDRALAPLVERPLRDFLLLATLVIATGGLHLDGLIDAADGLFGPGPAERRLATMRESWAGQRGACAALATLTLQYAALTSLPSESRLAGLLLAPTLGRWAIVYAYAAYPYARRTTGLSLALKRGATPAAAGGATVLALLIGGLVCWPLGLALLAQAWLIVLLLASLALRRIGGLSGDVYGALEQLVETATLLLVPLLSAALGCRSAS
jgi:adenosylcobinamide-GDP ribazoletransferase